MRPAALLCAALALAPTTVRADDPLAGGDRIDVSGLDLEELLDLEVTTATRTHQPIEVAPATISVLTGDQLRDYGWGTLNDVLWSLPGTVRSQDYERRLVSMRGSYHPWNHNRLLLLVDGVPLADPETGAAWTWEPTPLFVARRVEVMRGPGAAIYGDNAVLGAVAVETLRATDLAPHHVEARLTVGTRSAAVDAIAGADDRRTGGIVAGVHLTTTAGDERLTVDGSGRLDDRGELARFTFEDERRALALLLSWSGHGAAEGISVRALHQDFRTELGVGWWDWAADRRQYVDDRQTVLTASWRRERPRWQVRTALQLQHRGYTTDLRQLPAGALDGYYPDGVDEVIRTSFDKLYASGQWIRKLPRGADLVVGADYSGLLYRGDDVHMINADPDDPDGAPWDGMQTVGDVYEPIAGRPMHGLATYGQLTTGGLLGARVEVTAGARLDVLRYRFEHDDDGVVAGGYRRVSPRLAVVVRPADSLTIKAMAATAFRLPTPIELFSSHSFASTGNHHGLEAESERTYELATDWAPTANLRVRANAFYVEDDGLIDYAPGDGELQNLYDNRRLGVESEVTFAVHRDRLQADGWLSYAYNRLIDEEIHAQLSTEERLTWVPAHVAKLGARVAAGGWRATVQVYGQGRTYRRQTDMATPELQAARPTSIAPWADADVTLARQLGAHLRVGVRVTGLLDRRAPVPATRDVGFDYRVDRREAFVSLEAIE